MEDNMKIIYLQKFQNNETDVTDSNSTDVTVLYSYDAVPKAFIKAWIDVSFANILTYWRLNHVL